MTTSLIHGCGWVRDSGPKSCPSMLGRAHGVGELNIVKEPVNSVMSAATCGPPETCIACHGQSVPFCYLGATEAWNCNLFAHIGRFQAG